MRSESCSVSNMDASWTSLVQGCDDPAELLLMKTELSSAVERSNRLLLNGVVVWKNQAHRLSVRPYHIHCTLAW